MMLLDHWREWLYPFGYLAQLVFGLRLLQQWFVSEQHQKSIVTPIFWRLSVIGNVLLVVHGFIQLQFHVTAIQLCNAIIAWRNLNLMKEPNSQFKLRTVIVLMVGLNGLLALFFVLPNFLFDQWTIEWFRLPTWNGQAVRNVSILWHILGTLGMMLFASRFWAQWLIAEWEHRSIVRPLFWWLSFCGGIVSVVYANYIGDPVNGIGPGLGLISYIRNLMLIHKKGAKPVHGGL